MNIEKVHKDIRYTLSNDNLQNGDKVYPIAQGRCIENGWILHGFNFKNYCSGFPDEPHTILNLNHSEYKPYQVRTDHGYSAIESYYKIIKKEKQIDNRREGSLFSKWEWIEF